MNRNRIKSPFPVDSLTLLILHDLRSRATTSGDVIDNNMAEATPLKAAASIKTDVWLHFFHFGFLKKSRDRDDITHHPLHFYLFWVVSMT